MRTRKIQRLFPTPPSILSGNKSQSILPPTIRCMSTTTSSSSSSPPDDQPLLPNNATSSSLTITNLKGNAFVWTDISGSGIGDQRTFKSAINKEFKQRKLPTPLVNIATTPLLLPQCTFVSDYLLLSTRYCTMGVSSKIAATAPTPATAPPATNGPRGTSVEDISQRLIILLSPDKSELLTVHRKNCKAVEWLAGMWETKYKNASSEWVVNALTRQIASSYEDAIKDCYLRFDKCESTLIGLRDRKRANFSYQIYDIKRQASVFHRILKASRTSFVLYQRFRSIPMENMYANDVTHYISTLESMSEDLDQHATALLQLNFEMAAHYLNDLMRVLTVISVLFLPINFVAAFFGMNFEHLPFLEDEYGWLVSILSMIVLSAAFIWTLKRTGVTV
eukprot:PhF_6_TR14168/c0_g1_i1/m.22665/K03284/corA; magnesium transporter